MTHIEQRNQDATLYVGELDLRVDESLLWELMLQSGPVVNVHIPRDKLSRDHQGFGFVEFMTEPDADYAIRVMNLVKLYGKPIRLNKASRDKQTHDIGANLFIGNLDPEVDEKQLWETFSRFGVLIAEPKIMREVDGGANAKGFAFINYDSFESADSAIEQMNGQYLCGRVVSVNYAFKKDSKTERHGSMAERILAANNPNKIMGIARPAAPPPAPVVLPSGPPAGFRPPGMITGMPGRPPIQFGMPPGMPPPMMGMMRPGMPPMGMPPPGVRQMMPPPGY